MCDWHGGDAVQGAGLPHIIIFCVVLLVRAIEEGEVGEEVFMGPRDTVAEGRVSIWQKLVAERGEPH